MKFLYFLTASLLVACQVSPSPTTQHIAKQSLTLQGKVHFPPSFTTQNTSQTPYLSTVSLIYPPDHPSKALQTLVAGSTDQNGLFSLALPSGFSEHNNWFMLEASRRQSGASPRQRQSLRTWVKPLTNGWQSLSGSSVHLSPESTALSLLLQWNNLSPENFTESLSSVEPISYTPPSAEASAPDQNLFVSTTTLVQNTLQVHLDPIAKLSQTDITQYQATKSPQNDVLQETLYCPYCDLTGTDLSSANLNLSDLTGANLQYANLSSAQLINANLDQAQLTGARLDQATWINGSICETPSISTCTFEQRVNENLNSRKRSQKVGADANGNYVITWVSANNFSGQIFGLYARRYNALGIPLGQPFLVTSQNTGQSDSPDIAVHKDGRFFIVWQDSGIDPSGNGLDIYGRWFDAEGEPEGPEVRLNSELTNHQYSPKVGLDDQGNSVVAWDSFASPRSLMFRRFNADKQPQGNDTPANPPSQTLYSTLESDLAVNEQGEFALTWTVYGDSQTRENVFARAFNVSGQALSGEIQVNQHLNLDQKSPVIALDNSGNMTIAWQSEMQDENGFDTRPGGSGTGVYARRILKDGTPVSDEFRVNHFIKSQQDKPSITVDKTGRFVIAWKSWGHDYNTAPDLFLQRFHANGSFMGSETKVNTTSETPGYNLDQNSALASSSDHFVVTWEKGSTSTNIFTQMMGWEP